jgi:hypothetical protein
VGQQQQRRRQQLVQMPQVDRVLVALHRSPRFRQAVGMVPARALVVALPVVVVAALQQQGVLDYHMEWAVLLVVVVDHLPWRRREELPQLNIVVQRLHRPHHPRMMMMGMNHSLIS